jgi:hypothetical protein
MKRIVTSLLFAAGLLAAATVSFSPTRSVARPALCCDDPAPVCPPFCSPPPGSAWY